MSTTVDGRVFPSPQMAAIRSVFTAMFDAVDTVGDFDEERWADLIHALNVTGRLVFGWPHLDSSESDIFAALDDIATELTVTKEAIEKTTADARLILFELRQAVGSEPESREPDDDPGRSEQEEQVGPIEPPGPAETELSETPPTNFSVPRADEMLERARMEPLGPGEEPVAVPSRVEEVPSRGHREASARGRYDKDPPDEDVADYYETHTKAQTAAHFNISAATVARKVRRFEADTGVARRDGAVPRTPLAMADDPANETFEERRARLAREKANVEMERRRSPTSDHPWKRNMVTPPDPIRATVVR